MAVGSSSSSLTPQFTPTGHRRETSSREFVQSKASRLHFTAPKGSREQNVGDRPQQVVRTGGREGGAEHHHHSWKVKRDDRITGQLEDEELKQMNYDGDTRVSTLFAINLYDSWREIK